MLVFGLAMIPLYKYKMHLISMQAFDFASELETMMKEF